MAIPDPYKAAKKNTGSTSSGSIGSGMMPIPTAGGSIPGPKVNNVPSSGQSTPKTLGIPKSGIVPAPVQNQPKSTFSTPEYADWQAKTNEQYANLEKMLQTPFSYDPNTDAGYLAQRELAQLRAGDATRNAMEAANEKGVFGSSLMTNQLGQIQQRAEQEAAAFIPVYRDQAYGQYQDRLAQAANLLNTSRALRGDQFNEAVTEGELTGSYMAPQARMLLDNLFALKSQAESPGITREARAELSRQADEIRSQLGGMGVDSSQFGAEVSLNNARGNMGSAGMRTLAGQQLDYNQDADQRNFDRSVLESDRSFDRGVLESDRAFEYTQGRDKVADARWEQEFERIKQQDGIQNALAWAQNSISQQNANTSAYSASTSRMNANQSRLMDIWQATGFAPAGIDGVPEGTPYASGKAAAATPTAADYYSAIDNSIYLSPEYAPGQLPGQQGEKTGRTIVNDRDGLEAYILTLGLSPEETMKLYKRYNIPTQ